MPGWTLADTHPTQGRTFRRPLDKSELCFLWNGRLNGASDSAQHFELRLSNAPQDAHLFSITNITKAWLSTKRRYPLAGATVQDCSSPSSISKATDSKQGNDDTGEYNIIGFPLEPHFIVQEANLSVLGPRELVFGSVTNADEAQQRAAAILNGPRALSDELLVRLYIFREAERRDVIHLMTLMAHCVTDVMAGCMFIRGLLDTLARGGDPDSEPAQILLEDRLAMTIPLVEREPVHLRSLNPAVRRWRMAVGVVISRMRVAKRRGGHTLPCRITRSTPFVAARPGRISTSFTHQQCAAIISNCRLHNITFGNAYLVLAQVAMTRVLYRRYSRGEISEEEWAYRKRQPYITCGPFNLRPYLDKSYFEGGGGGEFMLSINVYFYELPFMTLGITGGQHQHCDRPEWERSLSDGAPPFSDLLSFNRFLYRAQLVKKQATEFFSHPLLFEIAHAESQSYAAYTRHSTLQWMKHAKTSDGNGTEEEVLSVMDMPVVRAHGGSSIGNLDLLFPSEYPIKPTHPLSPYSSVPHPAKAGYVTPPSSPSKPSTVEADTTPKITAELIGGHYHAGPSELYLGAFSLRGLLNTFVYYDRNVFEDEVVREWLDEIKEAIRWYLARTHHQSDGEHV